MRALLVLLGLVSLAGMPYAVLMPIFADQILHGGPRGLGLLMGATGVGALCGALSLAMRSGVRGLGQWVATAAAAFGVVAGAVFAVAYVLAVGAAADSCRRVDDGGDGVFQHTDPVDGAQRAARTRHGRLLDQFHGDGAIGALIAGWAAERLGAPITVAIGGLISVAAAAVFAAHLPSLRIEARELIVAQSMAGGDPPGEMTGPAAEVPMRTSGI